LRFDEDAKRVYQQADINLVRRFNRCFDRLRENPFKHPNIKPLTGVLKGLYRYRVGDWRVIYEVIQSQQVVNILQIIRRDRAYQSV
jgi:mRNA interferase RelE/StbE